MNTKRILGIVIVLLVSPLTVSACSGVATLSGADVASDTIQVVGTGEVKGTPDIASIQMGISFVDADLKRVITNANQSIETITGALVAAGVRSEDIRTTNYGIWPEEIYDRSSGEPTGERKYHADLTLEVTIHQIDRMGEFIQVGLDAGVNNVYGINFGLEERTELESLARSEAIVDARARAEELAAGLGKRVGDAISISEGLAGSRVYDTGPFRFEGMGGGGATISPGQTTVSLEVIVVYELVK
ncbi:MAG: SIMPL domain-containing protein [Anaerolineales bacterium]|nr:SIMPL domain-containing protein [Anaerolineales bacterium]